MAMCYIILVVPDLLADTGIPHDAATAATIWITILSTLVMGLWAQFPVGVAPGLGLTAYFAYYVCGPAGYTWQTGLGAVLISGIIFTLLTVTRVRQMIIDTVPRDLKYAIIVGIGAFIAFIGMKNSGLVIADSSTFVTLGDLSAAPTLLSAAGVLLIGVLTAHRIPGAMIIGIATISVSGLLLGISPMPSGPLLSLDIPLPTETIGQLDLAGALHHGLFSIIFTFNIATGFGFGFIAYVVLRLLSGRWREVSPILYIVAACFAINFLLRSL